MPDSAGPPRLDPPPQLLPHDSSLFLDFDGTLVAIADRPDGVVVDARLRALLATLAGAFRSRVALVSGRSIAQLDDMLGSAMAGLAVVGSHGGEIRAGGATVSAARPPALVAAEQSLRQGLGALDGVVLECKSLGIAAHFRLAPGAEPAVRAAISAIASATDLTVQEGKMMLELRSSGHDKGTGIAALMSRPPFAGTLPVFVGDDVTDEPGFQLVAELGGMGILVGEPRATAARHRLPDVPAVRAWLEQAA